VKTIIILLASLCLLGLGARAAESAKDSRMNIVFILADDLGWSDTTPYGNTKFHQTPNLERLAKRGMLFTRAYSASPFCSPTRASIMTGQSPARVGITKPDGHLPEVRFSPTVEEEAESNVKCLELNSVTRLNTTYFTLAEALKTAGYATAHFGKWHLGPAPYSPLEQGFDIDLPHHAGPGPAGSFIAPWRFANLKEKYPHEHIEDRMGDEAIAWMEKHKDGPFFLNYWQFSVHAPFDAKKALVDKYRAAVDPTDGQRSPTYAAMIESMDAAVGKLLDAIDRLGIAERTAIVFTSDNGGNMYNKIDGTTPTSNRPLRGGKGTLYEGGVRVPCIISWPKLTHPGSTNHTIIQSTDFYPTFLDLLSLRPQPGQIFDGMNIAPVLTNRPLEREYIYTYFPHGNSALPPCVSVTGDEWKLIRLFHQGENGAHDYRLYNLKNDLGEIENLASSQIERVKAMDALIENFLVSTHAVTPKPNPNYNPKSTPSNGGGKKGKKSKAAKKTESAK
jgi:arylsulfatase A-like enzyme